MYLFSTFDLLLTDLSTFRLQDRVQEAVPMARENDAVTDSLHQLLCVCSAANKAVLICHICLMVHGASGWVGS